MSFYGNLKKSVKKGLPENFYPFGQGLQLNGTNQYGQIANINGVEIPVNFSVVFWFRLLPIIINTGFNSGDTIFGSCENTTLKNLFLFNIKKVAGGKSWRPEFYFYSDSSSLILQYTVANSIPYDYMVHCLVYNVYQSGSNTAIDIYLDGALKESGAGFSGLARPLSFFNTYVGQNRLLSAWSFGGIIGDLKFIPQSLTAQQIKMHWNKGIGLNNLESLPHTFWYKFDGNGNDNSGNNRNLTITGSPTFPNFM